MEIPVKYYLLIISEGFEFYHRSNVQMIEQKGRGIFDLSLSGTANTSSIVSLTRRSAA
jgi:hypothetical protein